MEMQSLNHRTTWEVHGEFWSRDDVFELKLWAFIPPNSLVLESDLGCGGPLSWVDAQRMMPALGRNPRRLCPWFLEGDVMAHPKTHHSSLLVPLGSTSLHEFWEQFLYDPGELSWASLEEGSAWDKSVSTVAAGLGGPAVTHGIPPLVSVLDSPLCQLASLAVVYISWWFSISWWFTWQHVPVSNPSGLWASGHHAFPRPGYNSCLSDDFACLLVTWHNEPNMPSFIVRRTVTLTWWKFSTCGELEL